MAKKVAKLHKKGNEDMTVAECAKICKKSPQFIRVGLQEGRLPFGSAVKLKKWSYFINEAKFYEWVGNKVT